MPAIFRQCRLASLSVEQLLAKLRFECAHLAADGRLREVELYGGLRKAAEPRGSVKTA